jgi:hypothetical protein
MKNLVKKHFAKFVTAKGNIDGFYQQMRQQNLVSKADYGITPYEKTLEGTLPSSKICDSFFMLCVTSSPPEIGKSLPTSVRTKNECRKDATDSNFP